MVRRLFATLLAIALVAFGNSLGSTAAVAAPASTFPISAPSTIKAGSVITVTGDPGSKYAGRIAVLETVGNKASSFQLQTGTVRPNGRVSLRSAIALPGDWTLRVRVLEGRKSVASSQTRQITVRSAVRTPTRADMGSGMRMLGHAQTQASTAIRQGRANGPAGNAISPTVAQSLQSLTVVENAITGGIGAAQGAPQQQFGAGNSVVSLLGAGALDWGIGTALNLLMGVIFPQSNTTQVALAQISQQLQIVQGQLSQIESSLSSLEAQVTQEFAQLSAEGETAICLSLLQEANGYVNTLQDLQDQAQLAFSPAWIAANVTPYSNSPTAIRAIGNQMFGSGAGTPSFATGLLSDQQTVTDLAQILLDDGATGTPGLISACASAIAAQIVAANPTVVNGNPELGVIDADYFTTLQEVVAYYTTWVTVGQVLTAQGGQMAITQLQPEPPTSAAEALQVCSGATPVGPPSPLSCSGLLAQIDQTQQLISSAWNLTGASWEQVTDGVMASDTQIDQATGVFSPAINAWTIDLATYGSTPTQPTLPTVNSTSAATGPAAATFTSSGAPALGTTSWAGVSLQPADAADWDRLLGFDSLTPYPGAQGAAAQACIPGSNGTVTSCIASTSLGQAMGAVGLLANGAAPSNVIVYTGDTSDWNLADSSGIGVFYASATNQATKSKAPTLAVNAFLDTNFVPVQGASVVFGNPAGALTPASLYPYVISSNSANPAQEYPSAWQLAPAPTAPPLTGYSTAGPSVLTYCYPSPPLPTSGLAMTFGQILGLQNGASQLLIDPQPSCIAVFLPNFQAIPLTSNSSFYSPVNLVYNFDSSLDALVSANTQLASSLPGFVSGSSGPGAGGNLAQQSQYIWPVTPVANPGCGALTGFSQGVQGNLGVTNTCASLWQEWSAVNTGQTTGSVALSAPLTQGTVQASGANVAGVVLTNSGTSSQLVTLSVAGTTGGVQPQGMLTPVNASGALPLGCQSPVQSAGALAPTSPTSVVSCTFAVPPGISAVNIPVTYGSASSGSLTAALSGPGVASATTIAVTNTPATAPTPPGPVSQLAVASSTGTNVTLSWQAPSSSLPLTGYQVVIETPAGTSSSQSISIGSVTTTGTSVSASVALPAIQAGYWQFQVAATSSAGTGQSASTTSYLGSGPPPAPANLTAVENPDSSVTLTWTPITALPAVSGYTIVATGPNGVPGRPVTVSVPAFTTGALRQTGTWNFSVTATNTSGVGPASTASVTLLGTSPDAPTNLSVSIADNGWLSASWAAPSSAVPAPTSYVVRVYDPSGRATRSLEIPSRGIVSTVSVPRFFTLGSNSPTGAWTVTVAARNASGVGQTARSIVEVTPGLVSGISGTQSIDTNLSQVPLLLSDLDAMECRAGFEVISIFGSCDRRQWTLGS